MVSILIRRFFFSNQFRINQSEDSIFFLIRVKWVKKHKDILSFEAIRRPSYKPYSIQVEFQHQYLCLDK